MRVAAHHAEVEHAEELRPHVPHIHVVRIVVDGHLLAHVDHVHGRLHLRHVGREVGRQRTHHLAAQAELRRLGPHLPYAVAIGQETVVGKVETHVREDKQRHREAQRERDQTSERIAAPLEQVAQRIVEILHNINFMSNLFWRYGEASPSPVPKSDCAA